MPKKPASLIFTQLRVGDTAQISRKITKQMVASFAKLSGDFNPLHHDLSYTRQTPFKRPVVHGMLAGTLISGLLGMRLPGRYCLYLSQNLTFHKPIYFGTTVIVSGEIIQKVEALRLIKVSIKISDKPTHATLISGEAIVKLLK